MGDLFIGWDVGAWNCDALRALKIRESVPVAVGEPFRGNDLLVTRNGSALINELLRRLAVAVDDTRHLTIAID